MDEYSGYLSPFSWRYGSPEMRRIWSERRKRELWRKLWVALARVESEFGIVTPAQVDELEAKSTQIDIARSLEIESEIRHDLMAEIRAFAEICPNAGGIIHLGATSMDIEDNADALRMGEALDLLLKRISDLIEVLCKLIDRYADLPAMAFTHIQPAEPTTFGYRMAIWAQDLGQSFEDIRRSREELKGKGFKGAVGTSASYAELFGKENLGKFERRMAEELKLSFFPVATQTAPRLQEFRFLSALAGLGAGLHKMAFDLRILQSPPFGELSEPFGSKQVGSSAMPFKRNPIDSEKIDSLSRLLAGYPGVAWSNASLSLLERTLDDSANRRTILPEAFLVCDELLRVSEKVLKGLVVDTQAVRATFLTYAPFACTERLLMAMAKTGADRQETHEHLRNHALEAWASLKRGGENPLVANLRADSFFADRIPLDRFDELMDIDSYVGDAPERAKALSARLRGMLAGT